MPDKDAFLRWALDRMARRHVADASARSFAVPYAEAQTLADDVAAWIAERPDGAGDDALLIDRLDRLLDRHVADARSPQFQNQLFSGVLPEGMAGFLAGAFTNVTLSTREVAPLASAIETSVVRWLLDLTPWTADRAGGSATPAGSFSNYLAIYLARKRAAERFGDDALPRLAVFASQSAHYSIDKGADLAGIPRSNVIRVACDDTDHLDPAALRAGVAAARARGLLPFLVVATLGTTVTGVLDPVEAAADAVGGGDPVWLHVDAAWGGLGLLSSRAHLFARGLSRADSITWDAHKAAASPLALSFLLVKDRGVLDALRPAHGGGYLFPEDGESDDLGLRSLYCGKPFLSLGLWLLWKSRGDAGLREHADRAWRLAQRFRDALASSPGYELVQQPETPAVVFRPRLPEGTPAAERARVAEAVRARIVASGEFLVRLCPLRGEPVFRSLFVNPLFDDEHLERWLAHIERSR